MLEQLFYWLATAVLSAIDIIPKVALLFKRRLFTVNLQLHCRVEVMCFKFHRCKCCFQDIKLHPLIFLRPLLNCMFVLKSSCCRVECIVQKVYISHGKSTVACSHKSFSGCSFRMAVVYLLTTFGKSKTGATGTRMSCFYHVLSVYQPLMAPFLNTFFAVASTSGD